MQLNMPSWAVKALGEIKKTLSVRAEILINGRASSNYIGWSPVPCEIKVLKPTDATSPVKVILRAHQIDKDGGRVVFQATAKSRARPELRLTLPLDKSTKFFLAGKFGRPSLRDKDAAIKVIHADDGRVLAIKELMVRIRKDAETLTSGERDRFLTAMGKLNEKGTGRFSEFRDMHRAVADAEAHGNAGFLPWHRAYLIDLERELQAIDPSVALPYWRFDRAASNLFSPEFLGKPERAGPGSRPLLVFPAGHALEGWKTDGDSGIRRRARFDTTTQPANTISEAATLALGENYRDFRVMEVDPHGAAHVSFIGYLDNPDTAPKDPLFFLLHANVDRLWAKWQRQGKQLRRYDSARKGTYDPGPHRVGHNLADTMWPWNGVIASPRPPTAPGGALATSEMASAPVSAPRVRDMIDYGGVLESEDRLGFDYDDVPYGRK